MYRPGQGSFNLDNFDPNLCTIAIYAFAGLDPANDAIKSLGKLCLIIGLIRLYSHPRDRIDDCSLACASIVAGSVLNLRLPFHPLLDLCGMSLFSDIPGWSRP